MPYKETKAVALKENKNQPSNELTKNNLQNYLLIGFISLFHIKACKTSLFCGSYQNARWNGETGIKRDENWAIKEENNIQIATKNWENEEWNKLFNVIKSLNDFYVL